MANCVICGVPEEEHPKYKLRVIRNDGLHMMDKIIEHICYDEQASQIAYLIAKQIMREGRFSASVEILKHTPDKKSTDGIILFCRIKS